MAHKAQKEWCMKIKKEYAKYFVGKRVLDVGALDVNGNNRHLFENCEYIGLDVAEGKNVDAVSIAHEYKSDKLFDVILSTNALEHDMYLDLTLNKMVDLLKPNGFMFFTAGHKYKEHGTARTTPQDSGTSHMGKEWKNYYKNLNKEDIKNILDLDKIFKQYELNTQGKDLRFWGIKK